MLVHADVYSFVPRFVDVCRCVLMCGDVFSCVLMFLVSSDVCDVQRLLHVSSLVSLMCVDFDLCVLMRTDAFLIGVDVYGCVQMCTILR